MHQQVWTEEDDLCNVTMVVTTGEGQTLASVGIGESDTLELSPVMIDGDNAVWLTVESKKDANGLADLFSRISDKLYDFAGACPDEETPCNWK